MLKFYKGYGFSKGPSRLCSSFFSLEQIKQNRFTICLGPEQIDKCVADGQFDLLYFNKDARNACNARNANKEVLFSGLLIKTLNFFYLVLLYFVLPQLKIFSWRLTILLFCKMANGSSKHFLTPTQSHMQSRTEKWLTD